jgi:flagellar hook-associated protein 3 FlgL
MSFRVSDANSNSTSTQRINSHRSAISILQERLATGKRINRASDDPNGAEAVINIRTSQKEIEQFKRNASLANQKLTSADDTLGSYQTTLERVKTLVSQGLSDTTTQQARDAIALELESLRGRILNTANAQYGGEYIFGGTRQNASPYDPITGSPSAIPATARYIQLEPGANATQIGVTAETFLSDATSDIFVDLTAAVTALRGTGDPIADRATLQNTFSRLGVYGDLASAARSRIGANSNSAELALERLSNDFLSLDNRASDIEGADFSETVVSLTQSQQSLEATLQVVANGRRSLFDFLR